MFFINASKPVDSVNRYLLPFIRQLTEVREQALLYHTLRGFAPCQFVKGYL